jgi:hypothetical protein
VDRLESEQQVSGLFLLVGCWCSDTGSQQDAAVSSRHVGLPTSTAADNPALTRHLISRSNGALDHPAGSSSGSWTAATLQHLPAFRYVSLMQPPTAEVQ